MEHIGSITSRIAAKLKAAREGICGAENAAAVEEKPALKAAGSLPTAHDREEAVVDAAVGVTMGRGARGVGVVPSGAGRGKGSVVASKTEIGTGQGNQARMEIATIPVRSRAGRVGCPMLVGTTRFQFGAHGASPGLPSSAARTRSYRARQSGSSACSPFARSMPDIIVV